MWEFHTMFDEEQEAEPYAYCMYQSAFNAAMRFISEALTWTTLALEGDEDNGYLAIHLDGAKHPVAWLTKKEED